ncbi:EamA family transporter [Micromonospora rhizosphaerae]|uniref:EamA family transporter n=1 Tax=Micromonospora rhizosphaerae TaxID=568872 RepID=UPI000AD86DDE|nr:EamA family transporter [Micromonospora rhizosphaerae]
MATARGEAPWPAHASAPAAADLVAVAPQLAYAVLVAAVIAVLAWNTGVQRLGAVNAALFMNLVPVTTFVVQTARGYRPGAVELVGAALTIAALVAANLATRPRTAAPGRRRAPRGHRRHRPRGDRRPGRRGGALSRAAAHTVGTAGGDGGRSA